MDSGAERALESHRRPRSGVRPALRVPVEAALNRATLWITPTLTLVAAIAITLGVERLLAAASAAPFFAGDMGQLVAVAIPFVAGSILFMVGPYPLLRLSPAIAVDQRRLVFWMGLTFAAWGPVVAILTPCAFGFFNALLCAIVLQHASGRALLALLPVVTLVPAWAAAFALGHTAGSDAFTKAGTLAVGAWNGLMAMALAAWVAASRASQPRDGECPRCRYDRRGLPADSMCPECGSALPPARAAVVSVPTRQHPGCSL